MKEFLAVQPKDLAAIWPSLRGEVATIETPDGMIPEDVYTECKLGHATLFLLILDGKRVGWCVMKMIGPDLHIWQVFGDIGYEVLRLFRKEVMNCARGANARMLTYSSSRQGWNKVSKQHGFNVRMVVYECPIDPVEAPAIPAAVEQAAHVATDDSREDGTSHEVGN